MFSNNLIQKKREDFVIQIRKQQREEVFQRKRIILQVANEPQSQQQQYTPEEMMQFIKQSYMEEDFKQLAKQLKNYSDSFVKLINIMMNQGLNENDLQLLHQFTQQITTQKNYLFIELLRLGDVPREYNIQPARLDCLNQVLVIIINFTYLNGQKIVPSLFQFGIMSILLDDILGRIVQKEKLYMNNFEKWSLVFENISQIFINLILDSENSYVLDTKKTIINSSYFKIWYYIYTKNMCSFSWKTVIQLEQLLFQQPSIKIIESYNQSSIKMIQQCAQLIEQTELEDSLYKMVLELLFQLSDYQVSTTLTLTKNVWKTILKNNKFPNIYFSIFINFTSNKCEDYLTEKHLINIGIIENMLFYLENQNQDHILLQKLYKLFNNILFYNSQNLVENCLQYFIPYLNSYIKGRNPLQQQVVEEYFYLIRSLIFHQKLDSEYLEKLFIRLNIMEIIAIILLNNAQPFLKNVVQLFLCFDQLSIKIKLIILQKINQYQIIEIFNKIACSIQNDEEGCLETLFELLQNWDYETNTISEIE